MYWISNWQRMVSGNKIKALNENAADFSKNKHRALMLFGKPGIGKSCVIPLVAKELEMECISVQLNDRKSY